MQACTIPPAPTSKLQSEQLAEAMHGLEHLCHADVSSLPDAELEAAFSERTKAIVVNSPHNPTGKVFSVEDLSFIANLCQKWNVYAILDEVSRLCASAS